MWKNGSGKSTLMRLILGLYPGYTGKIWLGTQELREIQPEAGKRVCLCGTESLSV
ncbi:MAG: ATP-binding cassette domain-containing protein [Lachnospiraceae bacterium]